MRTTYIAKIADVERKWYVVDATGKTLGRLASEIATVLRGKNKPMYAPNVDTGDYVIVFNAEKITVTGNAPNVDTGDYVIVINAEKITVTGKKLDQKIYAHHSGYVGGLKTITLKKQLEKKPEEVIKHAVKGMLPKNALGRKMFSKLHVYAGPEHAHAAQKPEVLELKF